MAAGAASTLRNGRNEAFASGLCQRGPGPEMVGVLRRFRQLHHEVQLMMPDSPPAEQLAAWREEALAAFVPYGHRLAARRGLAVKELIGEPLVAVSGEAAPEFATRVHDLCRDAGFRPKVILESPRAQAVAVMVAAGAGIALLPASLARVVGDAAKVVPLAKAAPLTHVFARIAGEPSKGMRWLLDCLDENATEG